MRKFIKNLYSNDAEGWAYDGDWSSSVLYREQYQRGIQSEFTIPVLGAPGCINSAHIEPRTYSKPDDYVYLLDFAAVELKKNQRWLMDIASKMEKWVQEHQIIGIKCPSTEQLNLLTNQEIATVLKGYLDHLASNAPFSYLSWYDQTVFSLHAKTIVGDTCLSDDRIFSLTNCAQVKANELDTYSSMERKQMGTLLSLLLVSQKTSRELQESETIEYIEYCLQHNPAAHKMLVDHLKSYRWLGIRHMIGRPWDYQDILKRVSDFFKKINAEDQNNGYLSEKRELDISSDFTYSETLLVQSLASHIHYKTKRKEVISKVFYLLHPLFLEIARRSNTSVSNILYATSSEIFKSLELSIPMNSDIYTDRGGKFCFLLLDGGSHFLSSSQFDIHCDHSRPEVPRFIAENRLEGRRASPGGVTASALVLNSKGHNALDQLDRYILVAEMLTPEHILFLSKAVGIITSRGGMLCHAALLAREYNLPCITGIQDATRIIRSGDIITMEEGNNFIQIDTNLG